MNEITEKLTDLKASSHVTSFVQRVAGERNVVADRRANYLSLRPLPVGAIAVYAHSAHVSIAVEPGKAKALQSQAHFRQQILKTPATTYIIVKESDLATHEEAVVAVAVESMDWRAIGPSSTLGKGGSKASVMEQDTCPNCWTVISPGGGCWC